MEPMELLREDWRIPRIPFAFCLKPLPPLLPSSTVSIWWVWRYLLGSFSTVAVAVAAAEGGGLESPLERDVYCLARFESVEF